MAKYWVETEGARAIRLAKETKRKEAERADDQMLDELVRKSLGHRGA